MAEVPLPSCGLRSLGFFCCLKTALVTAEQRVCSGHPPQHPPFLATLYSGCARSVEVCPSSHSRAGLSERFCHPVVGVLSAALWPSLANLARSRLTQRASPGSRAEGLVLTAGRGERQRCGTLRLGSCSIFARDLEK